jgi:hypothetical protein
MTDPNSNVQTLPSDLREIAERLFSDSRNCKCDPEVGHVCESCILFSLLHKAATEIVKLRAYVTLQQPKDKEKPKTSLKDLPVAERTGMSYQGKSIYTIENTKGLYWLLGERDSWSSSAVAAKRHSIRGTGWVESHFARNREIEECLKSATG